MMLYIKTHNEELVINLQHVKTIKIFDVYFEIHLIDGKFYRFYIHEIVKIKVMNESKLNKLLNQLLESLEAYIPFFPS